MFTRLGNTGSDTFGVMDLASGYHQAPVSLNTQIFTAFITFCGIYQFTRSPFGPKRAPSYFQQMMTSIVLAGLLSFICEMYLDDCIVYAKGNDEFILTIEKVLSRFIKHKIFLNPNVNSVLKKSNIAEERYPYPDYPFLKNRSKRS
jgi:hypothetical protein